MDSPTMRAKMRVNQINTNRVGFDAKDPINNERVSFIAVGKNGNYPEDGSDENNTYASWTPNGECVLVIANPALFGKFAEGQEFYLDFTAVPVAEAAPAGELDAGSSTD